MLSTLALGFIALIVGYGAFASIGLGLILFLTRDKAAPDKGAAFPFLLLIVQ